MRGRWVQVMPLSALGGFIAISHELIWARLFNFVTGSRAVAFGAMLGAYLLGLALGALWIRYRRIGDAGVEAVPGWILKAGLLAWALPVLMSWQVVVMPWWTALLLVLPTAALLGTVFPALCEAVIAPDQRAGEGMAKMVLSNILGSGAGSLVTGFLLMEWLSLWQLVALMTGLGVWLALRVARVAGSLVPRRWLVVTGVAVMSSVWVYGGLYERLQYKGEYQFGWRFERVIESHHGVITVDTQHAVYGNGAYDGRIETKLEDDPWLLRPYFISAVHPEPRRVLMIGLASGGWAQILAHHPGVESVTAVEISGAYLELIPHYEPVRSILENPKIEVVIDDGRRWLRAHPAEQFDLICMNTTHHWREMASNLLSVEFLSQVKGHLAPGGMVIWNCTGSSRAIRSGMEVFPHTLMVMNNCIGSVDPILVEGDRWRQVLRDYQMDGASIWSESGEVLEQRLDIWMTVLERDQEPTSDQPFTLQSRGTMERLHGGALPITEDNLGHEFD